MRRAEVEQGPCRPLEEDAVGDRNAKTADTGAKAVAVNKIDTISNTCSFAPTNTSMRYCSPETNTLAIVPDSSRPFLV